jgi:hypothetical protein
VDIHRRTKGRAAKCSLPVSKGDPHRDQAERLLMPISSRELEHRWAAVRKAMREHHVEALVMQNSNDWLGGYVKWLTNLPAVNGYPRSVIFRASDLMTVVEMGARGAFDGKINPQLEADWNAEHFPA